MTLRRRGSHRRPLFRRPARTAAALAATRPTGDGQTLLARQDKAKGRRNVIVGTAAVILVLIGTLIGVLTAGTKQDAEQQRDSATAERDGAAAQVVSLADQIQAECRARRLAGPICVDAAVAKAEPIPTPMPSSAELTAAVADYLQANPPPPGRAPTSAEITAAVADYLNDNPPRPGRPPTSGEIAAAVQVYYQANPPPAGPQGDPGRAPTSGEIADAVAAYLRENPPPKGDKGDRGERGEPGTNGTNGTNGVGVRDVSDPSRAANGACVVTFTLTDNSTRDITVPAEFCGPPPSTEPTP